MARPCTGRRVSSLVPWGGSEKPETVCSLTRCCNQKRERGVGKEKEQEMEQEREEREKEREKARERAREEKEREQAGERERLKKEEGEEKSERRKGEEDGPVASLAGISVLRHGEGDGVHHGRQQVFPDGVGIPCSSDELVEQGNLLIRGSVIRQELPEVDFDRLDLGWVVCLPRRVLRGRSILLRVVRGRCIPGRGGAEGREAL